MHLSLNMIGLADAGFLDHPLKWAREKGIRFKDAKCYSINDTWLLIDVEESSIPSPLPDFLKEFKGEVP